MRSMLCLLLALPIAGCYTPPPIREDAMARRDFAPVVESERERTRLLGQARLSEADFLRLVEVSNPEIRALGHTVEAAAGRKRQAGLLPNPSFFAEVEEAPASGVRLDEGKRAFGLSYPLVVSGRIAAGVEVAEREKRILEAEAETRTRELRREARQALYRYAVAQQLASLEEELRVIASDFHETVRLRRAEKTVLELDEIKTAVELATQELATRTAEAELRAAVVEIRRIVGDSEFDVGRVAVQVPSLETLDSSSRYEELATSRHPQLRTADREIEWLDALADLAKREAVPDLEVSAAWGLAAAEDAPDGEDTPDRDDIVDVGVTVPLPLFSTNQGRIAEIEALKRRAAVRREGARQAILARVRAAVIDLGLRLERFEKYRNAILPEATRAVEQASSMYKEGKVLSLEVLDAQRVLGAARREYMLSQRALAEGVAEIESLTQE